MKFKMKLKISGYGSAICITRLVELIQMATLHSSGVTLAVAVIGTP